MTIKEMEQKARELREMLALIAEAQAEADAIKDELKAAMGDRESVQAGEYNKADNDPASIGGGHYLNSVAGYNPSLNKTVRVQFAALDLL